MNIAVIGAAGRAGSRILQEAERRGHKITAIVRHPETLGQKADHVLQKDLFNLTADDLRPFDAVVNAISAPPGREYLHVEAGRHLIQILSGLKTRLLVVGGAGSLYVDEKEKTRLIDTADFPKAFAATAANQAKNLRDLQHAENVNWTFLSPSALFTAGKRTGHYQTGENRLLINSQGKSYVSFADYAVALLDEIEQPKHLNQRFTVVSEPG
jgi:putative NADH-flavin reductase